MTPTPTPTIDESSRRKPTFADGAPIVLGDGQAWHFPRPVVELLFPRFGPGDEIDWTRGFDLGEAYDRLVEAYIDAEGVAEMSALARIADDLLSRQYDLARDELARLLPRATDTSPRFDEINATWNAIARVALGQAPEPAPAAV